MLLTVQFLSGPFQIRFTGIQRTPVPNHIHNCLTELPCFCHLSHNLHHSLIQFLLIVCPPAVTDTPCTLTIIPAPIRINNLIIAATIAVLPFILFCNQPCSAHRTLHQSGQKTDPLRIIHLLLRSSQALPLFLYPHPDIFRNNRLMSAPDGNNLFRILFNLLRIYPPIIYDHPIINRISQHRRNKIRSDNLILSLHHTLITILIHPAHNRIQHHIRFQILLINHPHQIRRLRNHHQFLIHTHISIRHAAARPSPIHQLLHPRRRELDCNILMLHFCHSRQDSKCQTSALRGTVNGILNTDQIHIKIHQQLHRLQNICRISSKAG